MPRFNFEIDSREYRRSHAKEPRGHGYWGFEIKRFGIKVAEAWHNGPYSEALRHAKNAAHAQKATAIKVLP